LKEETLKLMTQKTKQINGNYEQIKDKITLRENFLKNNHRDEDYKRVIQAHKCRKLINKSNSDFNSVFQKTNKNEDEDEYKQKLEAREERTRMAEATYQHYLNISTISGISNNLCNFVSIFKIYF